MTGPTVDAEVNAALHELLTGVQTVLGTHFVGLYLTGSLAEGDFNPQTSDIDFLVITEGKLPDGIVSALKAMHERLRASGLKWATHIEGVYVPTSAIRRYDPAQARYPHLGADGHFAIELQGGESIIQRHSLREQGVVVAGPDPKSLIDRITPDELRAAALNLLHGWWAPMLTQHPAFLQSVDYQVYAVLTMCRMWYTLKYGAVVSKPIAARWAQATLDKQWAALIEWALAWRPDLQTDRENKLPETLGFIGYTLTGERN